MQIECRSCDSPKCEGCNIYILATMLHEGKLDCLMDEHRSIAITPESLRPKGEWIIAEGRPMTFYECSLCNDRWHYGAVIHMNFCPNCGADMRGNADATT